MITPRCWKIPKSRYSRLEEDIAHLAQYIGVQSPERNPLIDDEANGASEEAEMEKFRVKMTVESSQFTRRLKQTQSGT